MSIRNVKFKYLLCVGIVVAFAAVALYAVLQGKDYHINGATIFEDQDSAKLEAVQQYRAKTVRALQAASPILQINNPTAEQQKALAILTSDTRTEQFTHDKNATAYRLEVLQSAAVPAGQATGKFQACKLTLCYRLDIFNFTVNTTIVAVIDVSNERVLAVQDADMQPNLSPELTSLATAIAKNNSHVKQILGEVGEPLMAGTKTALQRTVCERSRHLCVAPTFVLQNSKDALWVIVDLTDLKVVGTAWTKWGDKPDPITERQLSTEAVTESLCGKVTTVKRDNWAFSYTLTGSDGLELRDVSFKGKPVVASAKTVDWHVSYSSKDGFGYSDAVGCPTFSTAAVVPSKLPEVTTKENGQVILSLDFEGERWPEPCNYFYRQEFQMNTDGSLRVANANVGRGCGDDGTYRPVTRIELPNGTTAFERNREQLSTEAWWQPQQCPAGQGCASLSYKSGDTTYDVMPGNGQFNDGGRGDNPFLYVSRVQDGRFEGQQDLLTIGPCCNQNYQQGPEKFVNNEPLTDKSALWYVAQLKNNGATGKEYCWAGGRIIDGDYRVTRYPCYSGPLLKPRGN